VITDLDAGRIRQGSTIVEGLLQAIQKLHEGLKPNGKVAAIQVPFSRKDEAQFQASR
jgi:hypothetical protein